MDPLEDGGFTSRKFIICVGAGLIIVMMGILAGTVMPGISGVLPEVIGGILAAAGLFVTGNIASRYVVAKTNPGVSFQGDLSQDAKPAPVAPSKAAKGKKLPEPDEGPEDQE